MVTLLLISCAGCGNGDARGSAATGLPRLASEGARGDTLVVIRAEKTPYSVLPVTSPATVRGEATLDATVAALPPLPTGADSALCGASVPDESIQRQGAGVGGVVIWLEGIRAGKPLPDERRHELESDRCRLKPRVQAAVVGGAVNLVGHDDFRQHLRWSVVGESQPRTTVLLGRDEQVIPTELPAHAPGLVTIMDTDHSWPRAYLAVFDHPYYAVTSANGTFSIDGVPAGRYTLRGWHERAKPFQQVVVVTAGADVKVQVALAGR